MDDDLRAVAVVGAGSIGAAFAVLFGSSGMTVRVWDVDETVFPRCGADVDLRLSMLAEHDLLNEPIRDIRARISFHSSLTNAVRGANLVQECAPESLQLKKELFAELVTVTEEHTVLASSSSAIVPSAYSAGLKAGHRILGAHPGNPPHLLRVIELVPSPATSTDTLARAETLYRAAGLKPVVVRREIEGFLFNRLQGALLREAYCLLRDGIASVEDIDEVVRSGLGKRWSVVGPFETVDLNTRGGIAAHAERMGPAYERMGAERGQRDPWTRELIAQATDQRRALLPLEQWAERVAWRDEQLMHQLASSNDSPRGTERARKGAPTGHQSHQRLPHLP